MARKTTEQFIKDAKSIFPEYDYSKVQYINNKTKVIVGCPIHGYWEITPNSLLSGSGCRQCFLDRVSKNFQLTKQQFLEKATELYGDRYDYSNVQLPRPRADEYITIICPVHGEFKTRIHNFLNGHGCPKCRSSKGESIIKYVLDRLKIDYIEQYFIKIGNKRMYIDFYLPKQNTLIEFNGIQHYRPVRVFGGLRQFLKQVIRDIRLHWHCYIQKINIITIKYNQIENIETILNKKCL